MKTTTEDVEALKSSQEEADTRIVLYCQHSAEETSANDTIIVRSPDTDVFDLSLSYQRAGPTNRP